MILVTGLQLVFWHTDDIIDIGFWSSQGNWFLNDDARAYDWEKAYGHPGGTIMEGTIILQKVFPFSEEEALKLFVSLFIGLIAGVTALVAYVIRKDLWWIAILAVTLSIHRIYFDTTPTSALSGPLLGLLVLYTLYIHKRLSTSKKIHPAYLIFWGVICGLSAATRLDISGYIGGLLILFLYPILTIRHLMYLAVSSIIVFTLFDPFMWFMPLTHLYDMVWKIFYHYTEFTPHHIRLSVLFDFSSLLLISMLLSLIYTKQNPSKSLTKLTYYLYGGTFILYALFLTSHYQAVRYFFPIIVIWEILLPLYFIQIVDKINFRSLGNLKYFLNTKCILFFVIFLMHVAVFFNHV